MDEDSLGAALHRATDDVEVPRDLVRQAQRLGRERRARRRSGIATLGVVAVVLVGGGVVVTSQQGGDSATDASSAAAGSSAEDGPAADADGSASAESAPTPGVATPESMQDASPRGGEESATCDPTLEVDGVPQVTGTASTPVRVGEVLDVAGGPLPCEGVMPGSRYAVVLSPRGSGAPTVLAEVTPADDGSFTTRVTVPLSTPPGPAALSVTASGAAGEVCPGAADCEVPGYRADLDVRPAEGS